MLGAASIVHSDSADAGPRASDAPGKWCQPEEGGRGVGSEEALNDSVMGL